MKVVKPTDTTHIVKIIPRYYEASNLVLELKNESTREVTVTPFTILKDYNIQDIVFDYDFKEGDRFEMKIYEGESIYYRGKIFATDQDPQNYKSTFGRYEY